MSKISTFFPNYQLREPNPSETRDERYFTFYHAETPFLTRISFLGMTETQKRALRWAYYKETPPVVSISHEKPGTSDRGPFFDPNELHRQYFPYAMAVVTVQCLGRNPQKLKIYFCDVELHEENQLQHKHSRCKGVYIDDSIQQDREAQQRAAAEIEETRNRRRDADSYPR